MQEQRSWGKTSREFQVWSGLGTNAGERWEGMIDITQGRTRPTESHQARLELCHLPRERSLATLAELAVLSLSTLTPHIIRASVPWR